jgi:type 1 fimbria pilin
MKITLLACLLAGVVFPALSASHGHGHIQVQGSIIDTACAIATGDADQSLDLGTLPASDLVNDGRGPDVPFTVHLVNCVLNGTDIRGNDHWKDVRITFDGRADGQHLFALQGDGHGEAVVITDAAGNEAEPGQPMAATHLSPGSMALRYRLHLAGNHRPLRPGRFYTTLRYFMEYD